MLPLCLVALLAVAPEAPAKGVAADKLLNDALAQAKSSNKHVFVAFSSPGCGWCKYLDQYHKRPAVEAILGKHFVFVKIDIVTNAGGEDLYKKYSETQVGVPFWVILAADGAVVADALLDGDMNVGFPYEPKEIAHYEKVIRKTLPKLADAEVKTLLDELKAAAPKKTAADQ